jgi:hypothetical protein
MNWIRIDLGLTTDGIYFSPAAVSIVLTMLIRYGAVDCAAPARSQVRNIVGHDGAPGVPFGPER